MRATEEEDTRLLLGTLVWHPVNAEVAEQAGVLGGDGCRATARSTAPTWRLRPRSSATFGC
jgi:hypothetical protein